MSVKGKATILIADDHAVFREGLKALISAVQDWSVVAEASDGFEVLSQVKQHTPDVLILDISMPKLGGVETIARLKNEQSRPAILVLSAKDDDRSVSDALKAGANGFLPKSATRDELEFAIKAVLKGQKYLSPSVCQGALNHSAGDDGLGILTTREREVMKLLCEGVPNRDVAKMLHISTRTIDSHRANILRKLGVQSNAELIQLAIKHGVIE